MSGYYQRMVIEVTFDSKTGGTLSYRSQSMFNLNELSTRGEDCQGITMLFDEIETRREW